MQNEPLRWLPGVRTLRSYERSWLSGDIVAGLVLTALLIPQGMAYAQLAGLPPVTGLYTTVLGLVAYAVFGPSRILVLGPDSALGPLIAATILPLVGAGGDPFRAVALAGALAVMMGLVSVAAGLARLGAVADLLSKPVRIGYLNGIAIVVFVSQLPRLFGFSSDAASTFGELADFGASVRTVTNGVALAIGVTSLVVIVAVRRWRPHVPGVLIAVVGAMASVAVFGLDDGSLSLVGAVPGGFPRLTVPAIGFDVVSRLGLAALGMAFVTLADTTALSRAFAAQAGETVDTNQEMVALGVANVFAGLFQGFPLSSSATRTAVAKAAGARSQVVGLVGAASIVVLLVWGNRLTTNMPTASLAAIVVAASVSLFDLGEMRKLWTARRSEFVLCLSAVAGVVVLGPLEGIGVAVALSIGNFVRRAWRPHDAVLARVAGRKGYHDLARHPGGSPVPGLVIYRFDAPLFFANAGFFCRRVEQLVDESSIPVKWVIVAAEPITDIDTTGAEGLSEIIAKLRTRGVELVFAELKGPVKDRLIAYGMEGCVDSAHLYPTMGTAVAAYLRASGVEWLDPVDGPRSG